MSDVLMTHFTRVAKFNLSAPGANTAIFTAISPVDQNAYWRIQIALTTSSVVNITVTDGTTTHKFGLNDDVAITAATPFTQDVRVPRYIDSENASTTSLLSYSLELETDGVVELLTVDERYGIQ